MAERVGFEPTVRCRTSDFESGALSRAAISPLKRCRILHCRRVRVKHFESANRTFCLPPPGNFGRMYRMKKFSRLFVACFLAWTTFSHAQNLNIGTSRDEADEALPKTYNWKVLDDATVRRTWAQGDRVITADFDDQQGGCIFLSISYPRGVAKSAGQQTLSKLTNGEKLEWKKANSKTKPILGMKDAMHARTALGNLVAVETKNNKVTRISLYRGTPTTNRFDIPDYKPQRNSGLGVSASAGVGAYLVQDETRRQATGQAIAANTPAKPHASDPAAGKPATSSSTPAEPRTEIQTEKVSGFVDDMTIIDWIIAGIGLLALLVLFILMFRKKPQPTTPIIVTELDSRHEDEEEEEDDDETERKR